MPETDAIITEYIHNIQNTLATKQATEPSYYPHVKQLIESLGNGVTVTVLPKQIECGAPDFVVNKGQLTIGHIEAKALGMPLDPVENEKQGQLSRYRQALPNLILTNYIEFRWYQNGNRTLKIEIGTETGGKIKVTADGKGALAKLICDFRAFDAPGVGTAKELAVALARLAHRIREGAEEALNTGKASDMLKGLHKAFQDTLIPDLKVDAFADMYAQTIAYGLFAARCETDNAAAFSRQQAVYLIPKTNPFLKALFEQITGTALDEEPYKWAVDELVQLLKKAEMAEVMKGFGKAGGKDDPVVYFYEDFLREYDKKLSEMRGVYYTPLPVVSYIVRSIDYLLKTRFARPQGLADEHTYILDPATGTGTFLYAVINEIYESMSKQGQLGKWDGEKGYVAAHLLPRIFGFELLMAPYVIAHLKLGLQLRETQYQFNSNQRVGVYLTNTLEQAEKQSQIYLGQYIVKEANEAIKIKKQEPIMVVLGNPPYAVSSSNRGEWIDKLIEDYKTGLNEKKLNLDDDYIKFIRFGQWRIDNTGKGILAFITNSSYLDGLTHRRMRKRLLESFSSIYILNLHGSSRRVEQSPDGSKDENVFDIQQGVTIGLFIREPEKPAEQHVYYADTWGLRESKYATLMQSDITGTDWQKLNPTEPYFFFVPKEFSLQDEYGFGWPLQNVLNGISGIETKRDNFAIDFDKATLSQRVADFVDSQIAVEELKNKYQLRDNEWNVAEARDTLKKDRSWENRYVPCLHRPFDTRYIVYSTVILSRPRGRLMESMTKPNFGLIAARQTKEEFGVLASSSVCTHKIVTLYDRSFIFPLYLYPAEGEMAFETGRRHNLKPEFIAAFAEKLGLTFIADGKGDLANTFGPEDIFHYAYAIFHSPTYRTRYEEFLKIDFPRLPLTSDKKLFSALAGKGAELVALHLMESPALKTHITKYPAEGSSIVEQVAYDEKTQRVHINKAQYFEGVPPLVWNFHVGGYQVCQKWLKDRKGRTLSADDIDHYQKIVVALKETIRLMAEIDALIPVWPIT